MGWHCPIPPLGALWRSSDGAPGSNSHSNAGALEPRASGAVQTQLTAAMRQWQCDYLLDCRICQARQGGEKNIAEELIKR